MPTIPSLERRTVNPQVRMATVDPRGMASLGNVVGQGIEDVRGAFKDAKDKSDRYQLADAASKFSIMKNQQDNAYDEGDLEYETIPDRYALNVEDGLGEIAAGIKDPELRNLFLLENRPKVAAGTERMKNVAFGIETQVQRGNVNSRLNGLREVILNSDVEEDRVEAINNVKDSLSAAMGKGYYTPEEMVNLEKAFTVDAAIGYVDTLPIGQQRAALNSHMSIANIPEDVRKEKLRALEGAEVLEQAQQIARKLLNSDLSPDQIRKESSKYSGDLYEEVKRQLDAEEGISKRNELNSNQTFHSDYFMNVLRQEDGFKLEDLLAGKPEAFKGLSQQQKHSLISAAQDVIKGSSRTSSDPVVIDKLHTLRSEKKFEELRTYYLKNLGMLDSTDMDSWSKVSNEGVIPAEYKSKFNLKDQIDMAISDVEMKDINLKQEVRRRMNEWDQRYFEEHQEDPGQPAIDNQLKNVIRGVTLGETGFFGGYSTPKEQEGTDWTDETKPRIRMSSDEMTTLANETIDNPEGATKNNLNLIIGDILEMEPQEVDLGRVMDIGFSQSEQLEPYQKDLLFEKSLTHFDLLQQPSKDTLIKTLWAQEPETLSKLFNMLSEENGSVPTPDEILDGMRFMRDAR